ncbi:hypothetical protein KFE25_011489 [Diacronema lutheri]|uniref:Uncharacterized protein n=1 Tax=Diacronema lutheri TaxID=2081491 RepID=A0A8J6C6L6_DIALT|nr:hypothetical protein KFE25_009826 [Diacronema lutheri]KAG8462039.1 hypothetical protein KFE25_011489 [Diacronema lutheri]
MVHPMMGAAFLGGSFAGMASRHVGALNVISLTTGTLTGIWLAQNHPQSVPNLKDELRRFAAAVGEAEDEAPPQAHWTRGAMPLDETVLTSPVKEAVAEYRERRKGLERADRTVRELVVQGEDTRARLTVALAQLEEEKKVAQTACHAAHERVVARMDELKLERRAKGADRERLDYFLETLRELRDLEVREGESVKRPRRAASLPPRTCSHYIP